MRGAVGLSMGRRAVTKQMARPYAGVSKKERTGSSMSSARSRGGPVATRSVLWPGDRSAEALRKAGPGPACTARRSWDRSESCVGHAERPAGKRLAPFMAEIVSALERCGELELTPEVRDKLLRIAATIDRLLAPERARLRFKGHSGDQVGQHPQTTDRDPDLRRVERGPCRVLRDGPGDSRRRRWGSASSVRPSI